MGKNLITRLKAIGKSCGTNYRADFQTNNFGKDLRPGFWELDFWQNLQARLSEQTVRKNLQTGPSKHTSGRRVGLVDRTAGADIAAKTFKQELRTGFFEASSQAGFVDRTFGADSGTRLRNRRPEETAGRTFGGSHYQRAISKQTFGANLPEGLAD